MPPHWGTCGSCHPASGTKQDVLGGLDLASSAISAPSQLLHSQKPGGERESKEKKGPDLTLSSNEPAHTPHTHTHTHTHAHTHTASGFEFQ